MRILSTLIFLQLSVLSFAFGQDSTSENADYKRSKKIGFYFSLDIRRSVVRDVPVRISGLKMGVSFLKNHALGIGYYNLGRPILGGLYVSNPVEYDEQRTFISRKSGQNLNLHARIKLEMAYASLFYEHRFLARRKWNMDVTAQYGLGHLYIYAYDKIDGHLIGGKAKRDNISLVEGSVSVQYKIVEWFGIGAGFGYRYMINPNEYISTTFNYPIWTLKLILFPLKLGPVFKGQKKWYK
jgi:hypothetical protein